MSKWKVLNRSKGEGEITNGVKTNTKNIGEPVEKSKLTKTREESEDVVIKVYNETLYSKGFIQKQPTITFPDKKRSFKRLSWESLRTIEHNIDAMESKHEELNETRKQTSNEINNKVDRILYHNKAW